jgi:hypothetical protein
MVRSGAGFRFSPRELPMQWTTTVPMWPTQATSTSGPRASEPWDGTVEARRKDPADGLTKREVLTPVGDGKSSPEIAKILGLSVKTIEGQETAAGGSRGSVSRIGMYSPSY